MVPQYLRILTFFSAYSGWLEIDLRTLSLDAGIDYKHLTLVLAALEREHLLLIDHGRSDADPDGPKRNSYLLTDRGRAAVPQVLTEASLTGNFALSHPMWSHKGYGMAGLMVATALGPGLHALGSKEVAQILGVDRRSAIKRLKAWTEKGWAERMSASTYALLVPDQDPGMGIDADLFVPEAAAESLERRTGWVARGREIRRKAKEFAKEFGHRVPEAARKIYEAGVQVMLDFLDAVTEVVMPDPQPPNVSMDMLRRRGMRL